MTDAQYPDQPPLRAELLRFRTFGAEGRNGKDKETVFDHLRGRIRFAPVAQYNDPFESRPYYKPRHSNAAEQRAAVVKYACRLLRDQSGLSRAEAERRVEDYMRGLTQEEVAARFGEQVNAGLARGPPWVCCFSGPETIRSPLNWAHYADHHRGVCVHFATHYAPFKLAWPMRYTDEYPEVVFPRDAERPGRDWQEVEMQILTKSECWRYEDEYRLIRQGRELSADPRLADLLVSWDGDIAMAPREAVRAVTCGARMTDAAKEELGAWVRTNAPHVAIYHAHLHRRRYEVVVELVTRS